VAKWAKPLLIGHSACWASKLRALAGLGAIPDLEGVFFRSTGLAGMLQD